MQEPYNSLDYVTNEHWIKSNDLRNFKDLSNFPRAMVIEQITND